MKWNVNFRVLRTQQILVASVLLGGVFWMAGCKAAPEQNSGYLQNAGEMKKDADSPFNRSWLDSKIDESNYTEVLVRPVNIQYVKSQNIWEAASLRSLGLLQKDFEDIAKYTQKAFTEAVEKDPKHRFKIVQAAGPKTAVVELAITQLVPSKAGLNLIGLTLAPMGSVLVAEVAAGKLTNSQDSGDGVIAIEGRIRDGATGKVIYMFADRERGQSAIINLAEYTWWEPERRIIDVWAKKLVELASTPAHQKVKEPATFELLLW